MAKQRSLRFQFTFLLFLVLILIAMITGLIQIYVLNKEITREVHSQAEMIAHSIKQGMEQTMLASIELEHQIDLKLIAYARHVSEILAAEDLEHLHTSKLEEMRDHLHLGGITILRPQDGDIVGYLSTVPQDVGFSLQAIGFLEAGQTLLDGGQAELPGATYIDDGVAVLPIVQSGMIEEEPIFYKYAYYNVPNQPYIISVFIEADEVFQFTQEVGTETWIKRMIDDNKKILEVGVLTPAVFANPSLEKQIYPPMKRIVYGTFEYESDEDFNQLIQVQEEALIRSSIDRIDGEKVYKMFIPINQEQVAYIALNYKELIAPLYRHSFLLITSGFLSLLALFMVTTRFFSKIYVNIQRIINQIKQLEQKDFTVHSHVDREIVELAKLSKSTNRMVDTLNDVLQETTEEAIKVQRLAKILETDANQSVEKLYAVSMEATTKARDEMEEISEFLDQLSKYIAVAVDKPDGEEMEKVSKIQARISQVRQLIIDRSISTTEVTLTLADLFSSLQGQSEELAEISKVLLQRMDQFKLSNE